MDNNPDLARIVHFQQDGAPPPSFWIRSSEIFRWKLWRMDRKTRKGGVASRVFLGILATSLLKWGLWNMGTLEPVWPRRRLRIIRWRRAIARPLHSPPPHTPFRSARARVCARENHPPARVCFSSIYLSITFNAALARTLTPPTTRRPNVCLSPNHVRRNVFFPDLTRITLYYVDFITRNIFTNCIQLIYRVVNVLTLNFTLRFSLRTDR